MLDRERPNFGPLYQDATYQRYTNPFFVERGEGNLWHFPNVSGILTALGATSIVGGRGPRVASDVVCVIVSGYIF